MRIWFPFVAAAGLTLSACAAPGPPPVPPGVPPEFVHFTATELAEGDLAPDFDLPTADGSDSVRLSRLRGKPVVLVFGSFT
jgi:hypothetical protein